MQELKNTIEKLIDTSKYDEACELIRNDEENETEIDDWSPTETRDYITEIDYYL